jgi:hypothetical protein
VATGARGARLWGFHASRVPGNALPHYQRYGDGPMTDTLPTFERTHLERLKLAADILLSEHDSITDPMEAELILFRDRVEHALLLPGHPNGEAIA